MIKRRLLIYVRSKLNRLTELKAKTKYISVVKPKREDTQQNLPSVETPSKPVVPIVGD